MYIHLQLFADPVHIAKDGQKPQSAAFSAISINNRTSQLTSGHKINAQQNFYIRPMK